MKSLSPRLVVILSVLLLLPGLVYFTLRLALPGDASQPEIDFFHIRPGELAVRPLAPVPGGLRTGDIVTAIQGKPVDWRIQNLFSRQIPPEPTGRIHYTLLRDGRALQLDAPVTAFSLSHTLEANWSLYLYFIYLELVSLVVFLLRPRLVAAQLFFVASSILFSSGLVYFLSLRVDDLLHPWLVILYFIGAVAFYGLLLAALVHFSLVFPNPHPVLIRHPRVMLPVYLGVWLPIPVYAAAYWPVIASPAAFLVVLIKSTTIMSAIYFPLLLLFTYTCYRASNEGDKRRIRWIVWGMMISLVPYLAFSVVPSLIGLNVQLATSFLGILWCSVPTSFAIAVLHERLFDIDLIIRRTLVYSALTITLGAVYFVSIVLLHGLFQAITGQDQPPLATVLSTLIIAALFNPLRRRIQNDIDRRFYRRKYDAEKMLKAFGLKLRNEVELEKITQALLDVVDDTLEPEDLSLWVWRAKPVRPSFGGRALEESARSEY